MTQTLGFDECDIAEMSNEELSKLEREIARKYIGGMSWFMVVWPFANLICWLSLWPLVLTEILSVWIAFPIAFEVFGRLPEQISKAERFFRQL